MWGVRTRWRGSGLLVWCSGLLPGQPCFCHAPCLPLSCSNEVVRTDLKKLPALPTQALKEHPSLAYW